MPEMTNQEMMELAAKAAGMNLTYCPIWGCMAKELQDSEGKYFDAKTCWDPLTNDGDALRLAVKLRIDVYTLPINAEAVTVTAKRRMRSDLLRQPNPTSSTEELARDPYAATRRAIVRAAAEIGRNMK